MADTFTPALNLVKPEIDQSAETWGIKLNSDLELIDAHAATVIDFMANARKMVEDAISDAVIGSMPPGAIISWYGHVNAIPPGWHLCDGSGGTPDLTDRFIMGTNGLRPVGEAGGSDHWTVTSASGGAHDHGGTVNGTAITPAQMPAHRHGGGTDLQGQHGHGVSGGQFVVSAAGGGLGVPGGGGYSLVSNTDAAGNHSHNVVTDWQGSDQTHAHAIAGAGDHTHAVSGPITPPYVALIYIMRM